MSNTDLKKTIFAMPLIVAIAGLAGIHQAQAGVVVATGFEACNGTIADEPYDISGKVSTAYDCTILKPLDSGLNDKPQPAFVNGDTADNPYPFFATVSDEDGNGVGDWLFDGKLEEEEQDDGSKIWVDYSVLFDFTSGADGNYATGGTYTFAGGIADITDIMFVFKDGTDTSLVGYLLNLPLADGTYASGTYDNMFLNPPFTGGSYGAGGDKVSHISVYYRPSEGTAPPEEELPAPGTLLLLSGALVGLAATRRRRK